MAKVVVEAVMAVIVRVQRVRRNARVFTVEPEHLRVWITNGERSVAPRPGQERQAANRARSID